ncbi:MAG: YdeI/OmpD-associated family protein [Pseudoxanthomonas sp.]
MPVPDELPIQHFEDPRVWEKWLVANAGGKGIWLQIAKKDSGIVSVNYAQALEVALCHGWIDGQKRGYDEKFFLQRFTPRRPRSLWSKINIDHAERLIAAGRMRAGGLREIDAAKADGRWNAAYQSFSGMEVPDELAAALKKNKKAQAFFDQLDKTNRYSFCWRVQTAKKPETRMARAEKFAEMLAKGEKIH